MRIIDKTPLISEDGSISLINRIRGTLQYGFSWYPDLQVQQKAITILEKRLGKKFTLIRNHTLENSKIMVPIILIGPPGVQVIYITHLEGTYQAKNDSWGTISGGNVKEAGINLLKRTALLGKAVNIYLKRKEFELPDGVEAILLSVNPALHITTVRPIVRVVMSDAVERFAYSLSQKHPVMSVGTVHQISEAILNPRPIKKAASPQPAQEYPEEFDLTSNDNDEPTPPPNPSKPRQTKNKPISKEIADFFGLTQKQLIILGVMGLILVCLLIAFTLGILFFS